MKSNFASYVLNYLFLERILFLNFWSQVRDHIINIHPSKLLRTKAKSLELMNIKYISKMDNLHFLLNNILTRLFKELKIYIYKNDYQ